jgi:hypothetical protein
VQGRGGREVEVEVISLVLLERGGMEEEKSMNDGVGLLGHG